MPTLEDRLNSLISSLGTDYKAIIAAIAAKMEKSLTVTSLGSAEGWWGKLVIDYVATSTDPEPLIVYGKKASTQYRSFWLNESGSPRAQAVINEPAMKLYGPSSNTSYAGAVLQLLNHFSTSGQLRIWEVKADGKIYVTDNELVTQYVIVLNVGDAIPTGTLAGTVVIRKGTNYAKVSYWDGATETTDAILDSQITPVTPNDQTGTTYTFVLADGSRTVTGSNASAQTHTVPPNSSVPYPLGTVLTDIQKGAGQITIAPGSGVTLQSAHGLKTSAQWATVSLTKILTDTWVVSGDTTT